MSKKATNRQTRTDDRAQRTRRRHSSPVHVARAVRDTPALPDALTAAQRAYQDAIAAHTVTFGIGPAGTGKTFLAVAAAVNALVTGKARRIILTRPAVEAGEHLGFLPGDLQSKLAPYLRPLYDALVDLLDARAVDDLMRLGIIEVAPLAYMRGRTLSGAFIILDEAQNATPAQLKMFLTRMGDGSRVVVTGDPTQTDLPGGRSGLGSAARALRAHADVHVFRFDSADVVRHPLIGELVDLLDAQADADAAPRSPEPTVVYTGVAPAFPPPPAAPLPASPAVPLPAAPYWPPAPRPPVVPLPAPAWPIPAIPPATAPTWPSAPAWHPQATLATGSDWDGPDAPGEP
ncbi:PhoH family protein [Deinococcus kurensis]|uniref:PhoH family protein n=1 Tax=Deinococcus kurensis TaxID=2662757 RepID=UPI0012D34FBF|nr:PhoH family protein [Deinococcus kurensis]